MKIKKAVIPAAGLGTRFLPITKSIPKEMLPIIDRPVIDFIVQEIVDAGIEELLIISGRNKSPIEDYFDNNPEIEEDLLKKNKIDLYNCASFKYPLEITFKRQGKPLGLGHAVLMAENFTCGEDFALLLGDEIIDPPHAISQLIEKYEKVNSTVIGTRKVPKEDLTKYGIIDGENFGDLIKVNSLVEKPPIEKAPSNFAIMGRYVIKNEIFEILKNTKAGHGGEIQLTDALNTLAHNSQVYASEFSGQRFDTGNKLEYVKAQVYYALQKEYSKELLYFLKNL